jgi:hypothetical protein
VKHIQKILTYFYCLFSSEISYCIVEQRLLETLIDDILEEYSWFNAICISYKKLTGTALEFDEFTNISKLELAQMVMNSSSCNGLKDFDNMLLGGLNKTDEEGENDE